MLQGSHEILILINPPTGDRNSGGVLARVPGPQAPTYTHRIYIENTPKSRETTPKHIPGIISMHFPPKYNVLRIH